MQELVSCTKVNWRAVPSSIRSVYFEVSSRVIHGAVPTLRRRIHLMFTMEELMRFPSESHIHFIECPANGGMEWKGAQMESVQFTHGMVSCCEWTGVKVSTLLDEVGVDPGTSRRMG